MRHLYVHVPFCRRRCSYCDFAIAVRKAVPSDRFVEAVLAEYAMRGEGKRWTSGPFDTLYLGGGTPSLLSPERDRPAARGVPARGRRRGHARGESR
jgi:oxygen-independent coproporphyrinogen III oxidase